MSFQLRKKAREKALELTCVDSIGALIGARVPSGPARTDCVDRGDISDPAAYMIEFAERLRRQEPAAVARWRVTLGEIFFGRLFQGETAADGSRRARRFEIAALPPDRGGALSSIFQKSIAGHPEVSGVKTPKTSFTFFLRDQKTFAMLLPELIVLPAANVDPLEFRLSCLYSAGPTPEAQGAWNDGTLLAFFRRNPFQVRCFLQFLLDLQAAAPPYSVGAAALERFIGVLLNGIPGAKAYFETLKRTPSIETLEDALRWDYAAQLEKVCLAELSRLERSGADRMAYARVKTELSLITSSLFGARILCFAGDGVRDNGGLELADTARGRYRFDYDGDRLTPIAIRGLLGEREKHTLYAVPPVSEIFYRAILEGAVSFRRWSAAVSCGGAQIDVSVCFCFREIEYTVRQTFPVDRIVFARQLPYICMWPFVAVDWREFFIGSVSMRSEQAAVPRYKKLEACERLQKIDDADLGITAPVLGEALRRKIRGDAESPDQRIDRFECSTTGLTQKSFRLVRTDFFPTAVVLSLNGETLGYWAIDAARAKRGRAVDRGCVGTVGFDFATTASVVLLHIGRDDRIEYVNGPGEYLYDVFNPVYGQPDRAEQWEEIHNYTMFGHEEDDIHKIYTYGQNNDAERAGETIRETRNFVTGRAVIVSPGFLKFAMSEEAEISDTRIYGNLKWPDDISTVVPEREKNSARDNFILNVLSWGVLKAKLEGCGSVRIHMSYPRLNLGSVALYSVNRIRGQLKKISGYADVPIQPFREAEANASYLIEGRNLGLHTFRVPDPERGFMIVDIGGGTTDAVICQYSDPAQPFQQKIRSEISFKFAGRELIDIPLLMCEQLRDMWVGTTMAEIDEVLKSLLRFDVVDTRGKLREKEARGISAVGFLLDNAKIKNDYYLHASAEGRQLIKFKFLALLWLLGRYVGTAALNGDLELAENGEFSVYFTGCASNGLQEFCAVDDADFYLKCEAAMRIGCMSADPAKKNVKLKMHSVGLLRNAENISIKEAVAQGLVLLDETMASAEERNGLEPLLASDRPSAAARPDISQLVGGPRPVLFFQQLLEILRLEDDSVYDWRELPADGKTFLRECTVKGKNGEPAPIETFYAKIGDTPVTDAFLALWLLEAYLDMRKSLSPQKQRTVKRQELVGRTFLYVTLSDKDLARRMRIALALSYKLTYKIEYPDEFRIELDGDRFTADDVGAIESRYLSRFNQVLQTAADTYPNGISFRMLYENDFDLTPAVVGRLNESEFGSAGLLTDTVSLTFDRYRIPTEQKERILSEQTAEAVGAQKRAYLAAALYAVKEKKKAACVSRGVVHRRSDALPMRFSFNLTDAESEDRSPDHVAEAEFIVHLKYDADDSEYYYAYRGIDVADPAQLYNLEIPFQDAVQKIIREMFRRNWSAGIDQSYFELEETADGSKRVRQKDLLPGTKAVRARLPQIKDGGITLTAVHVDPYIRPSQSFWRQFGAYRAERTYREAARLGPPSAGIGDLERGVRLLNSIPEHPKSASLRDSYLKRIELLKSAEMIRARALKIAGREKSVKKLLRAQQMLKPISAYRDCRSLIRRYDERIEKLKKRKKLRRAILIALLLLLLLLSAKMAVPLLTKCGDGAYWRFDASTSTLTFYGEGEIDGFYGSFARSFLRSAATSVTVEEGITGIGDVSFSGFSGVRTVSLPQSLTSVGDYAFCGCSSLRDVYLPQTSVRIAPSAFSDCGDRCFHAAAAEEPNDAAGDAFPVALNRVYEGNLSAPYDENEFDWYRFELTEEARGVRLVLYTPPLDDTEAYWDVSLRKDPNAAQRQNAVWSAYVPGSESLTVSDALDLTPGVYYVEIESCTRYSDLPYWICLYSPEQP